MATRETTINWIQNLPDVPLMLHLNDSASSLGSGIDKHQTLFEGGIWEDYHPENGVLPIAESGLVYILEWAETNSITTILERHGGDGIISDITNISKLGFFT